MDLRESCLESVTIFSCRIERKYFITSYKLLNNFIIFSKILYKK